MAYTTDLTKPQFELLEQVLPQSQTYKNVISRHRIGNAIFYQLKNGCQWRDLPADFPNWQTVYSQFRRWKLDGTWAKVLAELARSERERVKKTNFRTSAECYGRTAKDCWKPAKRKFRFARFG